MFRGPWTLKTKNIYARSDGSEQSDFFGIYPQVLMTFSLPCYGPLAGKPPLAGIQIRYALVNG